LHDRHEPAGYQRHDHENGDRDRELRQAGDVTDPSVNTALAPGTELCDWLYDNFQEDLGHGTGDGSQGLDQQLQRGDERRNPSNASSTTVSMVD